MSTRLWLPPLRVHTPAAVAPNCRAACYAVILLPTRCERCGCAASAAAFWVPPGHELLHEGDTAADDVWECSSECRLLLEVSALNAEVADALRERVPTLRRACSPRDRTRLWMNHCAHCGTPSSGMEGSRDSMLAWWIVAGRDAVIEIVLVPGRLIATANSWSVGEIADTVLESITAEAAREATTATDAGP